MEQLPTSALFSTLTILLFRLEKMALLLFSNTQGYPQRVPEITVKPSRFFSTLTEHFSRALIITAHPDANLPITPAFPTHSRL
ncbi:hypothetical protein J5W80_05475 [Akkermansia muciniphila]|uniref:hypothetical protein n=1 Tax=Akkermansia muciniphila TaxID=239935 RepID=UPI001C0640D4|nr:hypothetical protein [Akkermansia muciniphila]QWP30284.1 hypothetical protein J5W80_05475 [Akkermansia muciniphila]